MFQNIMERTVGGQDEDTYPGVRWRGGVLQ